MQWAEWRRRWVELTSTGQLLGGPRLPPPGSHSGSNSAFPQTPPAKTVAFPITSQEALI